MTNKYFKIGIYLDWILLLSMSIQEDGKNEIKQRFLILLVKSDRIFEYGSQLY